MKRFTLYLAAVVFSSTALIAENGERSRGDVFKDLTSEEREKVRKSLSEVWNDPAVLQARDEVRRATEVYQQAMKEALEEKDPEVAAIISRMKKLDGPGMRPPGGKGPKGDDKGRRNGMPGEKGGGNVLKMIESGPVLQGLTDEQKEIYISARKTAAGDVTVKALIAKLVKSRTEDEAIRERRIQLIEQIRTAFHEAVIEADPRVAEFFPDGLPSRPAPGGRKKPKE